MAHKVRFSHHNKGKQFNKNNIFTVFKPLGSKGFKKTHEQSAEAFYSFRGQNRKRIDLPCLRRKPRNYARKAAPPAVFLRLCAFSSMADYFVKNNLFLFLKKR